MNPSPNIELHIDTIVIEGIPLSRVQRSELGEAVVSELTRLLSAERRALPAGMLSDTHRLTGGAINLRRGDPAAIGRGIAASLFEVVEP